MDTLLKLEYRTKYTERTKHENPDGSTETYVEHKVRSVIKSVHAPESTDGIVYLPCELEHNLKLIREYIAKHPESNYPEVIETRGVSHIDWPTSRHEQ